MNLTSSPDPPVDVDESAMNHTLTSGSLQGTAAKMNDTERFHFKRSSHRCYSSSKAVILLLLIIFVDVIDAVFTPTTTDSIATVLGNCLGEYPEDGGDTGTGVCPTESAKSDVNGDGSAIGAMGDWDVSKVNDMSSIFKDYDKFNADISKWVRHRRCSSLFSQF